MTSVGDSDVTTRYVTNGDHDVTYLQEFSTYWSLKKAHEVFDTRGFLVDLFNVDFSLLRAVREVIVSRARHVEGSFLCEFNQHSCKKKKKKISGLVRVENDGWYVAQESVFYI